MERLQDQAPSGAPPAALITLTERFDQKVMDVPSGSARLRLEVRGEGEWDVVISPQGIELNPAEDSDYDPEPKDEGLWTRHLELDCGHVPQLERPAETHRAIREFFAAD